MKVWITKYALTQNIYAIDAQECHIPSMVSGGGLFENYHGEGREWHRTKNSALARAEEMRTKAIASHQKSIAKLEKLVFK